MTWCYLWWSMSYTVHRLILSYGLFIVSGCDLVCGVLCTWCGMCLVMWADRTSCYVRSEDITHWEILVNEKGAVVRYDDLMCGILLRVGSCLIVGLTVSYQIRSGRFPKWECGYMSGICPCWYGRAGWLCKNGKVLRCDPEMIQTCALVCYVDCKCFRYYNLLYSCHM